MFVCFLSFFSTCLFHSFYSSYYYYYYFLCVCVCVFSSFAYFLKHVNVNALYLSILLIFMFYFYFILSCLLICRIFFFSFRIKFTLLFSKSILLATIIFCWKEYFSKSRIHSWISSWSKKRRLFYIINKVAIVCITVMKEVVVKIVIVK